jgi:hypothetical protein
MPTLVVGVYAGLRYMPTTSVGMAPADRPNSTCTFG